ncbi:RNA-directed DNA polymerase, eukaryota [Tanacetum coccineum]
MFGALECDSMPLIVLNDECLISKDFSRALLGRVKEFASLPNLKIVLKNEGFAKIKIQYMGEFWVLLEFPSSKTKELFQENMGVGSWFSVLKQASTDFIPEGRIVWVEIEGVPFKLWSKNTFKRIAAKWGELLDVDDQKEEEVPGWVPEFVDDSDDDDESDDGFKDGDAKVQDGGSCGDASDMVEVPETVFEESLEQKETQSEDPFGIYSLFNKNKDKSENMKPFDHSLKYPPGFTPNGDNNEFCLHDENVRSLNKVNSLNRNVEEDLNGQERNSINKGSKKEVSGSVCSGNFKSQRPHPKGQKDWVKELCIKNKVNFLAIQETKLENMDLWCVKACWGNYAFDFVHSDSVGNSGGILCIWDPNSFRKNNVTVSDYFIMVRGVWLKTGVNIIMVAVYAPQELRDKRILWDYLEHVINQWDGEVVIMGDFNEVRFKSERFGSVFNAQGADVFNAFIASTGLEEVPLGGSSFTWCHKSATKMSKLDRFLISENLMISCPNISATSLDRYLSDHRPILLRESQHDYGPIPFRFFNHWLELDGFNKFVTDTWNLAPVDDSNAMRNVMNKLKFLKRKIREWLNDNRNKSKSVSGQFKEELQKLDADIDKGIRYDDIVNKRLEVLNSIQHLDKIQAMDVAQKAKIKWAIEGDENSRYFHGVLNKKRSQLNIRGIMVDGKWTEKPNNVKLEFLHHFRNRFEKPTDNRVYIDMNFPKSITIDQHMDLECAVSKEELKRAVWECGTDKSPGPDGFSFGFYRQFWLSFENDVFAAVSHFFTFKDIPNGCNSCFIALIPKVPDANMVKDFRPISLIGSIYKIIAKILANRLVGVLGDIVNEVQSAFIMERQILDGPFILNEVIQWCKLKKKQSLIFKVDFEKAYDSVRWDFLDDVLKKFGFGNKWCAWIQSCLRSSRGSIIINGSPTKEFQFFKGLKQGDPLSPFLFILIMESLHLSFQRVVDVGMHKVGGNMSRVQAWTEVVDKVKSRLSNWKMKSLSIGGRLTLLKSVLGSMPIFHMSIFRVPLTVLHSLESIRCHFFNGHELNSNKASWVKWKSVLASKEKGGLGVSSLYALNRALMMKWVWRFYSQKESLWARVIKVLKSSIICGLNWETKNQRPSGMIIGLVVKVLKYSFARICALETVKEVTVNSKMSDSRLENSLRRRIRRGVEHVQFNELSDMLQSVSLMPYSDRWVWSLEGSGEFSVASIRKIIDDNRLSTVDTKTLWNKCVPIKVNILAWKIQTEALPTRFNISRRGIDIDSILCSICECVVESARHVFFSCSLVRQILGKVCSWWDIMHIDVNSYVEWVNWMNSLRLKSKSKLMIEGVFYVVWWHVWTFRNKLLFEDKKPLKPIIFDNVVSRSYYWCKFRCKVSFSWDDWLKNPNMISL